MCGSPDSNSIATCLADGISTESGTTVKHAKWNANMQQWQLSGLVGVHKDAAPDKAGTSPALNDLGSYDALVIADAAVMRPGSAGFIDFEADSPGGLKPLSCVMAVVPCVLNCVVMVLLCNLSTSSFILYATGT